MATLNSLAEDVYTITNRPDLQSETRVALRKAIFKFHSADTFSRDLAIVRLQMALYTPTVLGQYRWAFDLTDAELFPRFRRLHALNYPPELLNRPSLVPAPLIDGWAALGPDQRIIPILSSDNLFDYYRTEKPQYAYIIGSALNIKLSWLMDYIDLQYYKWPTVPPLSEPTDPITSWICDQFPDTVIEEASATVFKMIGKDDESSLYRNLFQENLAMIKTTAVGEDAQ